MSSQLPSASVTRVTGPYGASPSVRVNQHVMMGWCAAIPGMPVEGPHRLRRAGD
jgi:hypothetical protein